MRQLGRGEDNYESLKLRQGVRLPASNVGAIVLPIVLSNPEMVTGVAFLDHVPRPWSVLVPGGGELDLMRFHFKNTQASQGASQFYGLKFEFDTDAIDTGAALALYNEGKSDAIYINLSGKQGAGAPWTDNKPTGLAIDLNKEIASSAERSTSSSQQGIQIFDWSSFNQSVGGPRGLLIQKVTNLNTDHFLMTLRANRNMQQMVVVAGDAGFNGGMPVWRLDDETSGNNWLSLVARGEFVFNKDGVGIQWITPGSKTAYILASVNDLKLKSGGTGVRLVNQADTQTGLLMQDNCDLVLTLGNPATNATAGFVHLPGMAGAPNGSPTTYSGWQPIALDKTNRRLWYFDASWKQLIGALNYTDQVIVDPSGAGDYTTITAAMAAISPDSTHRKVIKVYGNTTEPAGVITIKEFVSIIGSKKDTLVSCEGFKFGNGSVLQHRCELINLYVTKSGSGAIGLHVDLGDEVIVRGCGFQNFATGVKIEGAYSGLIQFEDSSVSGSTIGFDVQYASVVNVRGCNLYDNDTVFKFAIASQFSVSDTHIETFDTAILFDSASAAVVVMSVLFHNCRFLSASGGGSYTCRVVKSYTNSDTYENLVRGLMIRDCSFWLTDAKYVIEVDWNTYLAGGTSRFIAALHGNYMQGEGSPLHTTAWFKSDMSSAGFVHLEFGNNLAPTGVAVQDGTEPRVTGYAHNGLNATADPGSSYGGAGILYGMNRWGAAGSDTQHIRHGIATLASGTVTVSETTVSFSSRIICTCIGPSGTPGLLIVQNIVPSTSFDIVSSSGSDNSNVAWVLFEP
jgi:hypothetical protein